MEAYGIGDPAYVYSNWTLAQIYLYSDAIAKDRTANLAQSAVFTAAANVASQSKRGFDKFLSSMSDLIDENSTPSEKEDAPEPLSSFGGDFFVGEVPAQEDEVM